MKKLQKVKNTIKKQVNINEEYLINFIFLLTKRGLFIINSDIYNKNVL